MFTLKWTLWDTQIAFVLWTPLIISIIITHIQSDGCVHCAIWYASKSYWCMDVQQLCLWPFCIRTNDEWMNDGNNRSMLETIGDGRKFTISCDDWVFRHMMLLVTHIGVAAHIELNITNAVEGEPMNDLCFIVLRWSKTEHKTLFAVTFRKRTRSWNERIEKKKIKIMI